MVASVITYIGFAFSVFLFARTFRSEKAAGSPVPRGGVASAVLFMALQAFIGTYAAFGLVQDDAVSAAVLALVLSGCVQMSVARRRVADRLKAFTGKGGRFPHPLVSSVLLVLIAAIFAVLALEIPSNHDLTWSYPLCMLLEWGLVAAVMCGLFLVFQRRGAAPAVPAFALYLIGIAEYFVIQFKSMPIQPGDLSALSTAAAVGAGYTYALSAFCLYGLAFAAIAMLICQIAGCLRPAKECRTRRAFAISLACGLLCFGGVAAHVTLVDYYNTLYITVYTWRPLESYWRQGFLPTFISGAQTIKPPVPADYDEGDAKKLEREYADAYDKQEASDAERAQAAAQFDEEKPTVIAIMNETFSDLSIYQQLHAGYKGPTYFKSLSDTLQRGRLYVSAYGGGTANTEFEFLTGNTMAYLGPGVYPYTIYDLTETGNLAAQFKQLGYSTTAMHPNHGTNWNRSNVYQDFGFDSFLTIDDFQDAEKLRGMVTDKATYDKILQLLDENENPQFIFDVTMQNHSGYDTGLIPSDKQLDLSIDGMSDPEVNEYVSLIEQSDEALSYFIGKLRQMDRKVVLVFFGDHQPFFPSTYNDLWFTGEDEAVHAERLWQTDYIIWANYDVAGRTQNSNNVDLSTNYLGSELMQLIGAPLTQYQKAHMSLMQAMPAINSTGYEDRSLQWYLSSATAVNDQPGTDAQDAEKARNDYAKIQYYELFGDGKDVYTKHAQDAANETDPNLQPGTTKVK